MMFETREKQATDLAHAPINGTVFSPEMSNLDGLSWAHACAKKWIIEAISDLLTGKLTGHGVCAGWLEVGSLTFKDIGGDSLMAVELAWRCEKEVHKLRDMLRVRLPAFDAEFAQESILGLKLPTAVDMLSLSIADVAGHISEAIVAFDVSSPMSGDVLLSTSLLHAPTASTPPSAGLLSATTPRDQKARVSWRSRGNLAGGESFGVDRVLACETGPMPTQPEPILVRWRVNMGRCVDASALVVHSTAPAGGRANTKVFIGAHSRLVAALDAASGETRWRREVVEKGAPRVGDDASIEATSAITVTPNFYMFILT